jgi:hypothetical protein
LGVGDDPCDGLLAAIGDGAEGGVAAAVVTEFVREDRTQLLAGETDEQRNAEEHPPGAADEPEQLGLLHDAGVRACDEPDLVGRPGACRLRQIPYLAPDLRLLRLADEQASWLLGALLHGEDAPTDGDRDDGNEDPDLACEASRPDDGE